MGRAGKKSNEISKLWFPYRTSWAILLSLSPHIGFSQPPQSIQPPIPNAISSEVEAVLKKKFPSGLDDLRIIQDQVERVLKKALPATVGIELGGWTGSGVVVSADGLILTAGHVVGTPEDKAEFVFPDGRRAVGRMLGINRQLDCGMMQITEPPGPWPFVPMAPPDTLQPGNWVVATGQPGGVQFRRTPPVRLGRVLTLEDVLINTDCTLVGGDSGGPLFDLRGRLVGIHSRIGEGLTRNFHVPIGTYLVDWHRLLAGEMWGDPLAAHNSHDERSVLGLAGHLVEGRCRVTQVFPHMPADLANLTVGDILRTFDGQSVKSFRQLSQLVQAKIQAMWSLSNTNATIPHTPHKSA